MPRLLLKSPWFCMVKSFVSPSKKLPSHGNSQGARHRAIRKCGAPAGGLLGAKSFKRSSQRAIGGSSSDVYNSQGLQGYRAKRMLRQLRWPEMHMFFCFAVADSHANLVQGFPSDGWVFPLYSFEIPWNPMNPLKVDGKTSIPRGYTPYSTHLSLMTPSRLIRIFRKYQHDIPPFYPLYTTMPCLWLKSHRFPPICSWLNLHHQRV